MLLVLVNISPLAVNGHAPREDVPTQTLLQSVCLFQMAEFEKTSGHLLIFSNQRLVVLVPWSAGKNDFGSRAANSGLL